MIASDNLCNANACVTGNRFQAAPVSVTKEVLKTRGREENQFRGVIINSGCANAVTGAEGRKDASQMACLMDTCFDGQPPEEAVSPRSFVMSTGVIGQRLPIEKIAPAIPTIYEKLNSTHESWLTAARAICTTDTFPKLISRTFTLPFTGDTKYSIVGIAKGAGMIHPNMGTLLSVICTDAPVPQSLCRALLSSAVSQSYNRISIDGDTSTNDTVALFANGAACPDPKLSIKYRSAESGSFNSVLTEVTQALAQLIVRDGEGATKFVRVLVQNSPTKWFALKAAESVARSPLVKTALYGQDANFGRIICAVGNAVHGRKELGIPQSNISMSIGVPREGRDEEEHERLDFVHKGVPLPVDEAKAASLMKKEDLEIRINMNYYATKTGPQKYCGQNAYYWFCDFSHEYVTINGDYRT